MLKHAVNTLIAMVMTIATLQPVQAADKDTVLITGANRGIGLALAQRYARNGYTVIGTARKPDQAAALKETGARIEQLDVTDSASVRALADRLDGVAIDVLINNAGVAGGDSRDIAAMDVDSIAWTLNVNTLGPLRVIQALYPNLQASDRKLVVNVSSMMGSNKLNTWGCCAGYRASKAGLNAINTTLAQDFGKEGMTFVVMHPGYVQTDMNAGQGNITPDQSAKGIVSVVRKLRPEDNGKFYDWEGKELPW